MKSKLFLAFLGANLFFVGNCFAKSSGEKACFDAPWSAKCQKFIRKRDNRNNIKQIPKAFKHKSKKISKSLLERYPNLVSDY